MFFERTGTAGYSIQKPSMALLEYKGLELETELRLDVLVEDILCVELKAQEGLLPIHDAFLLSYMQMLQKPRASSSIFIA